MSVRTPRMDKTRTEKSHVLEKLRTILCDLNRACHFWIVSDRPKKHKKWMASTRNAGLVRGFVCSRAGAVVFVSIKTVCLSAAK